MASVLKGITLKKERRLSQNADVLGVCLVAKHAAGSSIGTHSGSVVYGRDLQDVNRKNVFLITSEKIVGEEELDDLKSGKKKFNSGDYILKFLNSELPDKQPSKTRKLEEVTSPREKQMFNSGLVIIPIASEKLRRNSGLKTHRPFAASREVLQVTELEDSICQVVVESRERIDVISYKVKFIDGEYALAFPEKEPTYTYKTLEELTANSTPHNRLYFYGAVILKNKLAVAVLNFVNGRISPVFLSEVQLSVTQDQPVLHNPENSNAIQPDGDSISANIGDPPRDVTQDQPVLHNPENSNVIQPDGDPITANIGAPPRDAAIQDQPLLHNPENSSGTEPDAAIQDQPVRHNPENSNVIQPDAPDDQGVPHNPANANASQGADAAPQDQAVLHNSTNPSASQGADGTQRQLSKFATTINGDGNTFMGDGITANIGAPPRNAPDDQAVPHNPANANASQGADAAPQDQAALHNSANLNASQGADGTQQQLSTFVTTINGDGNTFMGDGITANIGVPPPRNAAPLDQAVPQNSTNPNASQGADGTQRQLSKFATTINGNGNTFMGDGITANIGAPPTNAAPDDQAVPHNPANANASQGADGTQQQLSKFVTAINGNGNTFVGDGITANIGAPPRNGDSSSGWRVA
ncbi:hypothetical protein ABFA07_016382 [Porites harrisoni]